MQRLRRQQDVTCLLVLNLLLGSVPALRAGGQEKPKGRLVQAAAPRQVATFDGAPITDEDLRKAAAADLDNLSLQINEMNANVARIEHQILETNLLRLLADKMFEAEAAKRGVSKEAYLEKELEGKVKDPTQQEISAFYEANKSRFSQPLSNVTNQIQQFLKGQNRNKALGDLADRLKPEYKVGMFLPPLRVNVRTEGSPSRGPKGAPVTIVEFSDFQCPYCSQLAKTLQEVSSKYGDKVRLVYKQYPLSSIHPFAERAAEAAFCAADQDRFWDLHDLMFQTQNALKDQDLKAKGAQLKLDTGAFNDCLTSGKYAQKVKLDEREGHSVGVSTTPSFFIDGRFFAGALSLEQISKTIDEEIALVSANRSAAGTASNAGTAGGTKAP